MNSDVKVRRFQASDLETVLKLHREGLQQTSSYAQDRQFDADLSDIPTNYFHGGEFLIALKDDSIVGMGAIRKIDQATAEIKRMRVVAAWQRKGIGAYILQILIKRAKDLGYHRVILDTTINMIAAQHLYEKHGFREYKRGEIAGMDCIFYSLDLPME